jgi:xylan 1,4-beta-xylosidase
MVTCPRIDGEWSDPTYLNSSGFDPSLFHDDDGRKYLVNMLWDHRPARNRFAGIVLQEYSASQRKLIGRRELIFKGTETGFTEGPHIYKRNGYYYLLTAEGGTSWNHAVTMARSRAIAGPYELDPIKHILTSARNPELELQKAGHADLVETQAGDTYMVHLCGRPLTPRGRCTLGRETAIQRMAWSDDDWLRTADGTGLPSAEVDAPGLPPHPFPASAARADFDDPALPIDFQWLRSPRPRELFSLTDRPGHLRLFGHETIGSVFRQSLVARRQQSHSFSATTVVEFEPENFQQMAGLVCYYNSSKFHYLFISTDEVLGKYMRVMTCFPEPDRDNAFTDPIPIGRAGPVQLRVEVDRERLRFGYRIAGGELRWIDQEFDASILSDDAMIPGSPNFTGAFVGMACQDMSGTRHHADFDHFEYEEKP